jgi:hypothetical protein
LLTRSCLSSPVTWDPTFFNGANTTVQLTGSFLNASSGAITSQAFQSPRSPAGWGFYAWAVPDDILSSHGVSALNISLALASLSVGSVAMAPFQGPIVAIVYPPVYRQEPAKMPTGPALYIGLPAVMGFVVLVVLGTCLWNWRVRRIGLGNIMSRSRHGYGIGKSRASRMRRRGGRRADKEGAIRLTDREAVPAAHEYRDVPDAQRRPGKAAEAGLQVRLPDGESQWDLDAHVPTRRDSDSLGSLVGTPTENKRIDFHRPNRGNAFRDELTRQERERP